MKLRYPPAKHDISGKMKTEGNYTHGFPQGAIVHFTAGRKDPVNTIDGGKSKYCFFVIAPNGDVYQNFDLNKWGSHAGTSTWPGFEGGVSRYFVGIEICNAGKVRQIDENTYRPWFNDPEYFKKQNKPVPAGLPKAVDDLSREEVRYVSKTENQEAGWYHAYTKEQEAALESLVLWMHREAPDIFKIRYVLGHDEVSPGRKNDPGGALSMSMPKFRDRLEALAQNDPAGATAAVDSEPASVAPESSSDDSSEQSQAEWAPPGVEETWFGRIVSKHILRTAEGDVFLSGSSPGDGTDPKKHPLADTLDREGLFVAIKGTLSGGVMTGCSLVESVPPVASALLSKLLEPQRGLRDSVLGIAQETKKELFGKEPPVPTNDPLAIVTSGPRPLCVLDIGHRPGDKGAEGKLDGKKHAEFDFNTKIVGEVAKRVKNAETVIISRENEANGHLTLPAKTNKLNPDFVVSFHANSNGSTATGSEVLYYHTSKEGKRLAALLQAEFLKALGLPDRKIKARTADERGGHQLFATKAPIVIGEPFFISNQGDLRRAVQRMDRLAQAYANAIDAYAAALSQPAASAISVKPAASAISPGETFDFEHANLSKERFLSKNEAVLLRLLDAVNTRLRTTYGDCVAVTKEEVWVLIYCEAGLNAGGKVDPNHKHSAKERGLLPLPSNVKYWNGSDAPDWDKPMPLARNIEHFLLYLGALKNKEVANVAGLELYRGLFRQSKISGNPVRQAKLLAGVVHGYFYSANYSDRVVPYDYLIKGYQNDTGLAKLMKPTTYKFAGTAIVSNRETNIEAGLGMV